MAKTFLIILGTSFSIFSAHATELESINVISITRSGDRMPVVVNPRAQIQPRTDHVSLEVRVSSNGCTQGTDFSVKITNKNNIATLAIIRDQRDNCKARTLPEGTVVTIATTLPATTQNIAIANPQFVIENYTY